MDFATKVKKYRAQHEWTQQVVAEKLGVSRKTISSWENGRSYPDIFMLGPFEIGRASCRERV